MVIHRGRSNHARRLDVAWQKIEDTEIMGLANSGEFILQKAQGRLKPPPAFSGYRMRLRDKPPEFVSIVPRHAEQHRDMVVSVTHSGIREIDAKKPFCRTPMEPDQAHDLSRNEDVKPTVTHRQGGAHVSSPSKNEIPPG